MFNDRKILALLLIPALLIFALLAIWPVLRVSLLSLFAAEHGLDGATFVWLENYAFLFSDPFFLRAIFNTVYFALVATTIEVGLGLAIAILFNRTFIGRNIAIPALVLPFILSTMVSASIWRAWFHFDFGFLNNIAAFVGLPRIGWLSDVAYAMPAIIIIDVWQSTAFTFLIILAGLQSIPKEIREASLIDGATPFRTFLYVTLPLLKRYIFLAFLLRTIDTFKIFDKIFVTTKGGPGNATEVLSLFIYKQAFRFSDSGLASASAVVLLLLGIALAAVYGTYSLRKATP